MNKSKNIGTAGETAIRKALLRAGYSQLEAHRNVLKGSADEGDVWLRHPTRGLIIFESKAGHAAENAGPTAIQRWLRETETEMYNANAAYGFLVVKKKGVGLNRAEDWRVWIDLVDLYALAGWDKDVTTFPWAGNPAMETTLGGLLTLLRTGAWVAAEPEADSAVA